MRKPKKKNTGKWIGLLFALCALAAGGFALYMMNEKDEYDEENKEIYERVQEEAKKPSSDPGEEYLIDWEKFKDTNIIGWIKFGEYIDYPIVQGQDDTYYLKHAYDGTFNQAGAIFLFSENKSDFSDRNSIIYGHNMYTGSMFGKFQSYLQQTDQIPKDIYIYTPDGLKHTYRVFSINQTTYSSIAYHISFKDDEEYGEYQKEMLSTSEYDVGGIENTSKKMITLSTCATIGSSQGKRVVILGIEKHSKKIQEPASWYQETTEAIE